MENTRFLHVQIYNSANSEIEYDNAVDTTWGVTAGTALLNKRIMQTELRFGEFIANRFEVQVYGINQKLDGRKIVVSMDNYDKKVEGVMVDHESTYIVTHDDDMLTYQEHEAVDIPLFTGYIDTSKTDNLRTDRNIIAYDRTYSDRTTNITTFWNTYWKTTSSPRQVFTKTLKEFRNDMLDYLGIPYIDRTLVNDNLVIHAEKMSGFDNVMFADIFSMICILQNTCPNVNGNGVVEFVKLGENTFVVDEIEGLSSTWQDYSTATITGVGVYDTGNELAQLIGSGDNVYKIGGNLFLLSCSSSELTTYCNAILDELKLIHYTPMNVRMIVSDLRFSMGDMIVTKNGVAYIMDDTLYSSLFIDETIDCPAVGEYLNKDVHSLDNTQLIGNKISRMSKTIDEVTIELADFEQNTSSQFQQLSDKIVLKVTSGGKIVQASLSADPSTGTEFKVGADNISFIANGKMELTANNLEINSTNFKVDSTGRITATSGEIGGFNIGNTSLYNGMTSLDDTTNNGVYVGIDGIALGKGAFQVSNNGSLTAIKGTIGGYTISSDNLSNDYVKLRSQSISIEGTSVLSYNSNAFLRISSATSSLHYVDCGYDSDITGGEGHIYLNSGSPTNYKSVWIAPKYGVYSQVLKLSSDNGVYCVDLAGTTYQTVFVGDVRKGSGNWSGTSTTSLNTAIGSMMPKANIILKDMGAVDLSLGPSIDVTVPYGKTFSSVPIVIPYCFSTTANQANVPVFAIISQSTSQAVIRVWKQVGTTNGGAPALLVAIIGT